MGNLSHCCQCTSLNKESATGQCKWFRWLSGSKTPSPTLSATPTVPAVPRLSFAFQDGFPLYDPALFASLSAQDMPAASHATPQSTLQPLPMISPSLSTQIVVCICEWGSCKSACIHPMCRLIMCRKHCLKNGGCDAIGHCATTSSSTTIIPHSNVNCVPLSFSSISIPTQITSNLSMALNVTVVPFSTLAPQHENPGPSSLPFSDPDQLFALLSEQLIALLPDPSYD